MPPAGTPDPLFSSDDALRLSGLTGSFRTLGAGPAKLGRYVLDLELGRGGFGVVYSASDPLLKRRVAVKVAARAQAPDQAAEMLAEARRLALLQHPGIVPVYDVGTHAGCVYIVTALLDGEPLSKALATRRFAWTDAALLVAEVADALAHAHAHSMIHRDVKPGNIFLTAAGRPVLLDFGLAVTDLEVGGPTGMTCGTPAYMSPEQASGFGHRVDGRTDVYSLGVVLYQMLCGRQPFRAAQTTEILRRVLEEPPQPPRQLAPNLPADVEALCLRAMAKDPHARPATAGDFAAALRDLVARWLNGPPAPASSAGRDASGPKTPHTNVMTPPSSRRREATRRQVTVLVAGCDAGPGADPEQRLEQEEAFRRLFAATVRAAGGALLAPAGADCAACFGFPTGREDAAARAARAALELERRAGAPLHAVLHAGDCVAEELPDGAPADVTLAGDVLPTAGRLAAQAAEPGVVATGDAEALLRGHFATEPAGVLRVRGAERPVPLFRVTGAAEAPGRVALVDPKNRTPLVGREAELAVLRDRWALAADGEGQGVALVADPGLGKSRLVRELRERVEAPNAVEWRCSSDRTAAELAPAADAWERAFGFAPGDAPAARLAKIEAGLTSAGLGGRDHLALAAALLAVPCDLPAPARQSERTADLVLAWLAASARRPLLFVVEDLHWADAATVELLGRHLEESSRRSVLTLVTARPEFRAAWLERCHCTRIALGKLSKRQAAEMVARRLGPRAAEVPPAVVESIVERTDGVPLFVEEFAAAAAEARPGAAAGSDSAAARAIPVTLQDLLAARLDRMASDPTVVQAGAAVGREFSHGLVAAAAGLPDAQLAAELDKLLSAELLFRTGRPPDCSYLFKHALIQDAAYASMPRKRRREMHGRIAAALAADPGARPEAVARHAGEAGDASTAVEFWTRAGRAAQARSAAREAVEHCHSGLDAVQALPVGAARDAAELELQLSLGAASVQAKGYTAPEVADSFDRAEALCRRIGPGAPLFYTLLGKWMFRAVRGEYAVALPIAEAALAAAEASGDDGLLMEALFPMANTLHYLARHGEALAHAERGLPLYDAARCREHARYTGENVGVALPLYAAMPLWRLGRAAEARAQMQVALARARTLDHPFSLCLALFHNAWFSQLEGDAAGAASHGAECLKVSKEYGLTFFEMLAYENLGMAKVLSEPAESPAFAEGADLVERSRAGFASLGAGMHATYTWLVLADARRRQGRRAEALAAAEAGLAQAERTGEAFVRGELERLRGEMADI